MEKKIDIKKHILVPKHTKLTESEKKEFLEKYHITVNELPKISIKDPAIRDLNPKIGDVIKIERKSRTAQETIFYRGVCNV